MQGRFYFASISRPIKAFNLSLTRLIIIMCFGGRNGKADNFPLVISVANIRFLPLARRRRESSYYDFLLSGGVKPRKRFKAKRFINFNNHRTKSLLASLCLQARSAPTRISKTFFPIFSINRKSFLVEVSLFESIAFSKAEL